MAENLSIINGSKTEQYEHILPQIGNILRYENNLIANMSNVTAMLNAQFNWFWTGFYIVDFVAENLVLGPFQGPLACTRIGYGKGVCGSAWNTGTTIIVDDVNLFEGHIACNSASQSEIVIPLVYNNTIFGVLDIDSSERNTFDHVDQYYLERITDLLTKESIIVLP